MPLSDMRRDPAHLGSAAPAAAIAGGILLLLYAATAAPGLTFWDAGEFATAFATFGIPHPPGTPLFVLLGRTAMLALPGAADPARAGAWLSVLCTAGAAALLAALVARWTRSVAVGVAGALCAGTMSTVWTSATETEVYAAAMLLSWGAIAAADRAGRGLGRDGGAGWATLAAYLMALAVPLHLSVLVAAPAVVLLAADRARRPGGHAGDRVGMDLGRLLRVGGAAVASAGAGLASVGLALAGAALLAVGARTGRRAARGERPAPTGREALAMAAAVVLGVTPVIVLLVRSRLGAALDQGHPATLDALVDVIARRQYAVAPLWPRQAPWWLQLGNLGEWADWQVALGLDAAVGFSPRRSPFTLAFLALAAVGSTAHARAEARSWRALVALLLAASVGVVAWLNLKAGPTYGYGFVPDDALREARERDYFFSLAFTVWGVWAGVGAATLARRWLAAPQLAAVVGVALAALPAALNWRVADRRAEPDARIPAVYGEALLRGAPPNAVVFLNGDNDSYAAWYAQLARGVRRDLVPVTVSLLGAPWYRAELARRHGLLEPDAPTHWLGTPATMQRIADRAAAAGRPVAAALPVATSALAPLGGPWALHGLVRVRHESSVDGLAAVPGSTALADTVALRAVDDFVRARLGAQLGRTPRTGIDAVAAWAQGQLRCPGEALAAARGAAPARSLESDCDAR